MQDRPSTIADGLYRTHEVLGQGGMATVVRAYDQLLQVHRAIKLLAPAFRDKERIRQRFMDEARVMARLRHPNIVPVFDVGEQDGTPYIVMGLVEGGDLAEHIVANKTLDIAEAIRLHWGSENACHWVADVILQEDKHPWCVLQL